MKQQACEETQRHQSMDRMAGLLETHVAREEVQWLGMKEWLEDREAWWDKRYRDNVLWGTGITDMTSNVLGKARVGEAALARKARNEERDETARQKCGGLEASQQAGATQEGEPVKCQLQQQLQPKPKQQLKQQPELQHQPKPVPTPTLARRWATVQPQTQSQKMPAGHSPALMAGSSMAERTLLFWRDECIPLPN